MRSESLKQWREAGRELLAADAADSPTVIPSTLNDENRTVDIVWFTGVDVPRIDWWTGDQYILRFDPSGADLSILNSGAPILDDHDKWEGCAGQQGVVDKAWTESKKYLATIRFSKRPEVDGLWQDIKDRIVQKFSMGVEILQTVETRGADGKLEMREAMKWRPFELSVTPIPADFGTTTLHREPAAPKSDSALVALASARRREIEILSLG